MVEVKRTVAVDFDNTIATYEGWSGIGEFGEPIENAQWALKLMKEQLGYEIIIYTCRSEIGLVREYLEKHEIPFDYINHNPKNAEYDLSPVKILADIYIDDRAIGFRGSWNETMSDLAKFRLWNADRMVVNSRDIK